MTRIFPTNQKYETITFDPKPIKINLGSIYDMPHHTFSVKCSFFYDRYKKLINFLIVCLIVSVIIIICIFSSSNAKTKDNPCISYKSDDYASSISIDCFRYLWKKSCNNDIPSNFDGGWWLRSPSGGQIVPCNIDNIDNIDKKRCGAGNYGNIVNNIFRCNLYYEGL